MESSFGQNQVATLPKPTTASQSRSQTPRAMKDSKAPTGFQGREEDTAAFVRKRNALYSKKKYYKRKQEVANMTESMHDLRNKNNQIRKKNFQLEALLIDARRKVEMHLRLVASAKLSEMAPPQHVLPSVEDLLYQELAISRKSPPAHLPVRSGFHDTPSLFATRELLQHNHQHCRDLDNMTVASSEFEMRMQARHVNDVEEATRRLEELKRRNRILEIRLAAKMRQKMVPTNGQVSRGQHAIDAMNARKNQPWNDTASLPDGQLLLELEARGKWNNMAIYHNYS